MVGRNQRKGKFSRKVGVGIKSNNKFQKITRLKTKS